MARFSAAVLVWLALLSSSFAAESEIYDVVIYGGSSSGAAAALQTAQMGKSVILIEPGGHLGGLTSGGLGATDIGNKAAIGGISREFYQRVKQYYDDPKAWRQEKRSEYRSRRFKPGEATMWTFEPHAAEKIYREMLRQAKIKVAYHQRLDLKAGVKKQGARIVAIKMEGGQTFRGRMFIDATYEGDLMALAGVSYHVGREANSVYGETLNGVQTRNAIHHQMQPGVDPYLKKGDPSSGLLPGVHAGPLGEDGSGDRKVQAYCFRMCLTDAKENQIPFAKPKGYDSVRYELLLRNFEAGERRVPWSPTLMPNRKTDTNNNYGFSTDNINMNYDWAEGDYAARKRIFQEHLLYQRGLMWTLASHPRVPRAIREEVGRWGNSRNEFPENKGWSHQLYVREARRMISDLVMTQHECQGRRTVDDSVGLAAYTMDSHNIQRYVDADGHVRNEGDVQVGGFPPYPISYRSLRPKESQCANLLVPICLSASHIAYGSIRMEPVFMVLGQSAATAACQAIDQGVSVQRIDYAKLRERLLADEQVLLWTGPRPRPISAVSPSDLPGIVLDDGAMKFAGDWKPSRSTSGFVAPYYWHDSNEEQGKKSVRFIADLKKRGRFEVRLAYASHGNRATNAKVTVKHSGGEKTMRINQRKTPPIDKTFISLGEFDFSAGKNVVVEVSNSEADGYVIADAVQLLPVKKE